VTRIAARLLAILSVLTAFVMLAAPAQAAESIPTYTVAVSIQSDTRMVVKESITYDFAGTPERHGIFRDLVVADEDSLGRTRQYEVNVSGVTVDGMPTAYTTSSESNVDRIRIGDPDTTVSGTHTYVITYTVANALRVITADDVADPQAPSGLSVGDVELFWDLIENTFDVPITAGEAAVTGPAAPLASRCFVGSFGSTQACALTTSNATVHLGPTPVDAGQFLTASIVYPASAFTTVPQEVFEPEQPLGLAALIGGVLFLALCFVPIVLAIAWRRQDKGVAISGTPVQYEPPDRLTAVEMAAAWKGDSAAMRPRALIAALTDLAARGHVVISDVDHLTVTRLTGSTSALASWESSLLDQLFADSTTAALAKYDASLAQAWEEDYDSLVTAAEQAGRRNAQGGAPDRRWNWMFLVAAVGVIAFIASIVFNSQVTTVIAIAATVGALLGGAIARIITPRRETTESARFLVLVLGFRRLLETDAAEARREFAQRLGLPAHAILATMLPYAIVFSLEESWIGAFPDLTPEELRSTGFNVVSIVALSSVMNSATHSASTALTAPSSGSGGGGMSGGGGGGGGGGAW